MKKNNSVLLSTPYILWMIAFTLIPLGVVGYYALTDPATGVFTFDRGCCSGQRLPHQLQLRRPRLPRLQQGDRHQPGSISRKNLKNGRSAFVDLLFSCAQWQKWVYLNRFLVRISTLCQKCGNWGGLRAVSLDK